MGAGNVQAVFDRYANVLPWRTFAALVFMAKTSIDAHDWPYYSAGLDTLTSTLYRTSEPTGAQHREVRRLVRAMVDDEVVTKDREASSLRRRAADRPARYRLNIHERADLARKQWEADQGTASTGVGDPCADDASTGVNDPPAEAPSTGVSDPSKYRGDSPPKPAQAQGSQTPGRSKEPEEEVEEDARTSGEPVVPRPPADEAHAPAPHCSQHEINPSDTPCRRCGDARKRREAWAAARAQAEEAWRTGVRQWMAWADKQPNCDCDGKPGGNLIRPDTGVMLCPRCRAQAEAAR